ncbi:MAG: histidine phosphatase family protein [Pseudomonadota bacterium]
MGWLVIVRHGNTFDRGETVLRVGGRTDLPLSQSGQVQAQALRAHFAGQSFDHCLCGPLARQRQTAEAILEHLSRPDHLEHLSGLTEIDYGPDEGQPEEAVIARIGADALTEWDTNRVPHPDWHIDPDGLRSVWGDLLARAMTSDLIVVTSNGTARYLFDHVDRGNAPLKLRTGAFGVIAVRPEGARLISWDERPGAPHS